MGLDNFARRGPEEEEPAPDDLAAFEAADIQLCGGILSGDADSFRGKVYDILVTTITGESLLQDWIPPDRVKRMYEALAGCDPEEVAEEHDARFGDTKVQIDNLRKFFKVCVERNLGLIGWW
jgi:hypothetical protein